MCYISAEYNSDAPAGREILLSYADVYNIARQYGLAPVPRGCETVAHDAEVTVRADAVRIRSPFEQFPETGGTEEIEEEPIGEEKTSREGYSSEEVEVEQKFELEPESDRPDVSLKRDISDRLQKLHSVLSTERETENLGEIRKKVAQLEKFVMSKRRQSLAKKRLRRSRRLLEAKQKGTHEKMPRLKVEPGLSDHEHVNELQV